jgi:hypothetical protein
VFSGNWENLFGQYGMDPKGNNESGAWARRNQQLTGAGMTGATDFAVNFLEPGRQANLRTLLPYLSAGNTQQRVKQQADMMAKRGDLAGMKQASLAGGAGFSPEYQQALRQMASGKAQRNANEYIANTDEQVGQNAGMLNDIMARAQQNPFLPQFLALAQLIEGRHAQNNAEQQQGGLGGMLGSIGQLMGMFGGIPGLGGLGGGKPPQGGMGGFGNVDNWAGTGYFG